MKNKRLISIITAVLVIIILFFIFGTPKYQAIKVTSKNFANLENRLKEEVNTNVEIDLKALTDFDWDECFVFPPYSPSAQVYEKVGTEWTKHKTFIGYVIFHGTENETVNDDQYLIVFKKDNKVVLSAVYSLNQLPVIFNLGNSNRLTSNNAKFTVTAAKQYPENKFKELVPKN